MRERLKIESSVVLSNVNCGFSASHVVVGRNFEEAIHGHDYKVGVELFGLLDDEEMIIDFVVLENILKEIVLEWDHYTLLPLSNPNLKLKDLSKNIEISYGERVYSLPKSDIKLLKCNNVTAEAFAKEIALKLTKTLYKKNFLQFIEKIKVTLWETSIYHVTYCISKPFEKILES